MGTIHPSGNIFFSKDQVLPKRPEECKTDSESHFSERYNQIFFDEKQVSVTSFKPNFEIYLGNDSITKERVQIKILKNFGSKKEAF